MFLSCINNLFWYGIHSSAHGLILTLPSEITCGMLGGGAIKDTRNQIPVGLTQDRYSTLSTIGQTPGLNNFINILKASKNLV